MTEPDVMELTEDAQALDTRIQVWPCRSGGICNWKR